MAAFDRNVFVNCPFDPEYRELVLRLVFTIYYLGLVPRIAFERANSGELRLSKIRQLIRASRFSIHDLSRCRASRAGEYFRLNMPLELGMDLGCQSFSGAKWRRKTLLVLEKRKWGYQKALSDLAGTDIKSHGDKPRRLIEAVRDWLVQEAHISPRPASEIPIRYNQFMADDFERLQAAGHRLRDINRRSIHEISKAIRVWVRKNS